MAQTARLVSLLDRPWTLEDVISLPSDSESETDSNTEGRQTVSGVHLAHNQQLGTSFGSISASMASTVDFRRRPPEAISEQLANQTQAWRLTQDLYLPGERDSSDSSTSRSPREAISVRSTLEGGGITTDSGELGYLAMQQDDSGVHPLLPTSIGRPYIVLTDPECRSVSTPVLPPTDEALNQQNTYDHYQARLGRATNLIHPCQSQNSVFWSSNECDYGVNVDLCHMSKVVPQSDDELRPVARPASAEIPPSECSRSVLCREGLSESIQKHQAVNDILPLDPGRSSPTTGQRPETHEERQASIRAHQTVSQLDEPYEEMKKRRSSSHVKVYNLRCLPGKRQLTGEHQGAGANENRMAQRKHRKLVCRQPKKRSSH
ncbi:hypothetical protein MGU_04794 [Metarhizium guizhouense ARSEF 977]|uniref:Uncharacterized protein n=1 Tax=Metarhizium guizhouense (strain ARSEF 977) TaxID=1276136 RepID=A0A0B4GLE7_METGA|nr:hypothetical protein MGU_04794 [Metarhizium guizhouense ARSEF 977]